MAPPAPAGSHPISGNPAARSCGPDTEGKLCPTGESQPVKTEELENHHSAGTTVVIDLGENRQ